VDLLHFASSPQLLIFFRVDGTQPSLLGNIFDYFRDSLSFLFRLSLVFPITGWIVLFKFVCPVASLNAFLSDPFRFPFLFDATLLRAGRWFLVFSFVLHFCFPRPRLVPLPRDLMHEHFLWVATRRVGSSFCGFLWLLSGIPLVGSSPLFFWVGQTVVFPGSNSSRWLTGVKDFHITRKFESPPGFGSDLYFPRGSGWLAPVLSFFGICCVALAVSVVFFFL